MEETGAMTQEELIRLADPFAQLMNQMQKDNGESITDVVSAGLYAMGCAIAQIGMHIDVQGSVKESVTPLAMGYSEAMERVRKKMI